MTALTTTAALALWAFQPFDKIQDATRFMDSLPATACAQVSYGPAVTDVEAAESQAAMDRRDRERKAARAAWKACREFSESHGAVMSDATPTVKVLGGKGWKKFDSYSSPLFNTLPKNVWVPDCGYNPDMVIDATIFGIVSNRWVVVYRKEPKP